MTATALALILALSALQIPLTPKLTQLEGTWRLDPRRGAGGICGVPVADTISLQLSAAGVAIETSREAGGARRDLQTGLITLDGTETVLSDGRTAVAGLDAGWLAVTMKRLRPGGLVNVMREVYIVAGDELTIWRVLNTVLLDGSDGKIDCGNRHAIIYTRD